MQHTQSDFFWSKKSKITQTRQQLFEFWVDLRQFKHNKDNLVHSFVDNF